MEKVLKDRLGDELKTGELLSRHTSMGVGGPAEFFYVADKIDKLILAVKTAEEYKIPYFILGNGTNIIFSDRGFEGLVIKNKCREVFLDKNTSLVIVSSGVLLSELIPKVAAYDLGGAEFLFGIPGTIGGAIYNNAGAYGKTISDLVKNITILKNGEVEKVDKKKIKFDYRSSDLKLKKSVIKSKIILSAILQFNRQKQADILEKIKQLNAERKKRIPLGKSAGSFFKNPLISPFLRLTKDEEKELEKILKNNRIPAWWLIKKAGLNEKKIGDAQVSSLHANFIINTGRATATDIKNLAELIKETVYDRFGIGLEEEVEYVGVF